MRILSTLCSLIALSSLQAGEASSSSEAQQEKIRTLNDYGFAYTFNSPLTELFLAQCGQLGRSGRVLEIGCAYGLKSLQIATCGVELTALDLDPRHIAFAQEHYNNLLEAGHCLGKARFLSGNFLDIEVETLGASSFDLISMESVLHFFNPKEVGEALHKIKKVLKPGGLLFLSASSPYLKHFAPLYEEAKARGEPWPGFFNEPGNVHPIDRRLHAPYHTFDIETLQRALTEAGLLPLDIHYVPLLHHELDMALDGREGIVAIACLLLEIKP